MVSHLFFYQLALIALAWLFFRFCRKLPKTGKLRLASH